MILGANLEVLASLIGSGAVPRSSGGREADFSPFLWQGCCTEVLPSAVVLWEQEKSAQHTLWMCLSLSKSNTDITQPQLRGCSHLVKKQVRREDRA